MALLGRERLLAWAAHATQEAQRGHGRILLLSGEAGIGKTTLAQAIAAQAAAGGAVVRWGASWDGGGAALGAWIDALRSPGADGCAAVAARLIEGTADDAIGEAAAGQELATLVRDVVD